MQPFQMILISIIKGWNGIYEINIKFKSEKIYKYIIRSEKDLNLFNFYYNKGWKKSAFHLLEIDKTIKQKTTKELQLLLF